jgi:hypothetical protein
MVQDSLQTGGFIGENGHHFMPLSSDHISKAAHSFFLATLAVARFYGKSSSVDIIQPFLNNRGPVGHA